MSKIIVIFLTIMVLSSCNSIKPKDNIIMPEIPKKCQLGTILKWNIDYVVYNEHQTQQQILNNIARLQNIRNDMARQGCQESDIKSIFYAVQQAAKKGVKSDWLHEKWEKEWDKEDAKR